MTTRGFRLALTHEALSPPPEDAPCDIAFVDRDGVLNVHLPGYRTGRDLEVLPGAAQALAALNRAGVPVVVVTNQRGLARGDITDGDLDDAHRVLLAAFARAGAHVDDFRVCPHETGRCGCRKPLPGMLLEVLAANPWARPGRCLMFGDSVSDEQCARAAGVRFVRVSREVTFRQRVEALLRSASWEDFIVS